MTYKQKILAQYGLLLLGYAYALREETIPSILCAIVAVILAIVTHSLSGLKRRMGQVLYGTLLICIFLSALQMTFRVPLLPFLSLCNMMVSALLMESSRKLKQTILQYHRLSFVVLLLLQWLFPFTYTLYNVLYVCFLFLPLCVIYRFQILKENKILADFLYIEKPVVKGKVL